jgi:hypothetical protein
MVCVLTVEKCLNIWLTFQKIPFVSLFLVVSASRRYSVQVQEREMLFMKKFHSEQTLPLIELLFFPLIQKSGRNSLEWFNPHPSEHRS